MAQSHVAVNDNAAVQAKPIFLVGMMGAGKTTIGRQLAAALGREFLDLDQAIEERCGVSIPTIFDIEGEAGFRKRETSLLDELTRLKGIVLATGGGAILAAANRAMLSERGLVIYLRADARELYRRVARDRNRPLLQTPNPQQRIVELLEQREPLYKQLADVTLDTSSQPIWQLVRDLLPTLQA